MFCRGHDGLLALTLQSTGELGLVFCGGAIVIYIRQTVYNTIYGLMINSFDIIPQNSSTVNPSVSNYGVLIKYPSDWSKQELTASGTPINIVTFVSPAGPASNPTADVSISLDTS